MRGKERNEIKEWKPLRMIKENENRKKKKKRNVKEIRIKNSKSTERREGK